MATNFRNLRIALFLLLGGAALPAAGPLRHSAFFPPLPAYALTYQRSRIIKGGREFATNDAFTVLSAENPETVEAPASASSHLLFLKKVGDVFSVAAAVQIQPMDETQTVLWRSEDAHDAPFGFLRRLPERKKALKTVETQVKKAWGDDDRLINDAFNAAIERHFLASDFVILGPEKRKVFLKEGNGASLPGKWVTAYVVWLQGPFLDNTTLVLSANFRYMGYVPKI